MRIKLRLSGAGVASELIRLLLVREWVTASPAPSEKSNKLTRHAGS